MMLANRAKNHLVTMASQNQFQLSPFVYILLIKMKRLSSVYGRKAVSDHHRLTFRFSNIITLLC